MILDYIQVGCLVFFALGIALNCYATLLANRWRDEARDYLDQVEQRNRDFSEALALWRIGAAQEAIDLLRPHLTKDVVRREVLR